MRIKTYIDSFSVIVSFVTAVIELVSLILDMFK